MDTSTSSGGVPASQPDIVAAAAEHDGQALEQTILQEQGETSTAQVNSGSSQSPRGLLSTVTFILGLVNIIIGLVIDFVLEFRTDFSTFWSESLILALVGLAVLSLRSSRDSVALAFNVGIFVYLWFVHIKPFLFMK